MAPICYIALLNLKPKKAKSTLQYIISGGVGNFSGNFSSGIGYIKPKRSEWTPLVIKMSKSKILG